MNVKSVDRIIYSTFQRFNLESKPAPSEFLHKQLDAPLGVSVCRGNEFCI